MLKRAQELIISVGQKQEALQTLHSLITSKRYRAWEKSLEQIMFKYVELCVELRRVRFAKDGLMLYRIVCQHVNVSSLEEVIKHFMHFSAEKAEQARTQAQALEEALDVDDLEADKRPEDLMLSYVSGEKEKERSDRELVTPWFKFLWEAYRTVLEVVKNNSNLEALYAMTVRRAFQFCKQYKRITEFRRLCEVIRNHRANLQPESLKMNLNIRFEQLKVATELQLCKEAFRCVEDIHGLMCMVEKTPKAWVVYYAKLTEIFWISSSYLDHAYAWLKIFTLHQSFYDNLGKKNYQMIASAVVLAALAVPPYDTRRASHVENETEKLSRAALLSELVSKGVLGCATQEVQDIYHLLEDEFLPVDLGAKLQPLLSRISGLGLKLASTASMQEYKLSQYIPALEKLATLRLLRQVSQVYNTMRIENLSRMIPFFGFDVVERIAVDAVKHEFIAMKVDHMNSVVMFEDVLLESDGLRDHLAAFVKSLNKAKAMMYPSAKISSKLSDILPPLEEALYKEHKGLLARKLIIERRKEEQERQLLETEREQESKRLSKQNITEEQEQKRLAAEHERLRNQRIFREIEECKLEQAQALLDQTEKHSKRQEMVKKLHKLAKTMDYLERAKREEAAPLIEATFQQQLVEEKALHEREQQLEVELSRQRHAGDLKERNRLSPMIDNKMIFQERVIARRQAEFEQRQASRVARINQIIQTRRQDREIQRKEIFYVKTEQERLARVKEEGKIQEAECEAQLGETAEKHGFPAAAPQ
ncbi:unnamed protein product [Linum trigynum]|uniref:PCI domain-containing protein n=1 Tax=Linum trigynum TaxID=586398 RepID=A0AAV2GBI3_9ROSI